MRNLRPTKLLIFLLVSFFAFTYVQAQTQSSPADGSTAIALGNQTFDWSAYSFENDGTNEDDYYVLEIGTSAGAHDVYQTAASTLTTNS